MPTYNVQADMTTGDLLVVGRDGRRHALEDLVAADEAAERGDPVAIALLRSVDLSLDDDGRAQSTEQAIALAEVAIGTCPDCWRPRPP